MSDESDLEYFNLRKEGKTYISRVFKFDERSTDRVRQIRMVLEGSDRLLLGEIEGALCLRLTGDKRKTQVTALVSQDDKQVRRVSLQTFQTRAGDRIQAFDKHDFTFRSGEFARLVAFLRQIEFIDLSNEKTFQIEDISTGHGPKIVVDASERALIDQIKSMREDQREAIIRALHGSLTGEEVNILLGRRQGLEEFEAQIEVGQWTELQWQQFFDRQRWIFGYGLDYRIMKQFDREMMVGGAGTDNKNKPIIDFLMTFTDYTVLVEIKRPDTKIFKSASSGRAGTWEFSADFMGAVSQVLEQKAEWLAFAQSGEHYNKAGTQKLEARTRNAKTILVIGSFGEFEEGRDSRSAQIMRDTFELYRRENRTIDILTFDELLDRARFITRHE